MARLRESDVDDYSFENVQAFGPPVHHNCPIVSWEHVVLIKPH